MFTIGYEKFQVTKVQSISTTFLKLLCMQAVWIVVMYGMWGHCITNVWLMAVNFCNKYQEFPLGEDPHSCCHNPNSTWHENSLHTTHSPTITKNSMWAIFQLLLIQCWPNFKGCFPCSTSVKGTFIQATFVLTIFSYLIKHWNYWYVLDQILKLGFWKHI